jgi:4-hydroxybenzoate polyprenyltransferase
LWTLGFDTIYAMSDREDDQRIGINSSALFFGNQAATAVGLFFLGTVLLLASCGVDLGLKFGFWLTWIVAAVGWFWQYWQLQAKQPEPSIYGRLFRQNVWLGFLLLAGMSVGFFI